MKRNAELKRVLLESFWGIRPFKRHSLVLMVAGVYSILRGFVYILAEPTVARDRSLAVALNFFPIEVWGGVFILVGVLAFVSSRWPPVTETWGYMLLSALSGGWSATYLLSIVFEDSPTSNLAAALTWGMLAFLWWAIPGFVNPDKTIVVVVNDAGTNN